MKPAMIALICLLTLTACGADGPPTTPEATPAVGISGELKVGVSG